MTHLPANQGPAGPRTTPHDLRRVLGHLLGRVLGSWLLGVALLAGAGGADAKSTADGEVSAAAPESANALARQQRQRLAARVWRQDLAGAAALGAPLPWSSDAKLIEQGRRLYQEGVRANGQPLVGERLDGQIRLHGSAAACMLCHRRSALGAVEGADQIAPISGRYLFDQDQRAIANMNLRARKAFNQRHEPYTLETLAKALREGRHQTGRELAPLMPRYTLSDTEVLALASYLRRVSNTWSPGVTEKTVHFATVITPDADPERKRIFLSTLNEIVAQKNGNLIHGQRTMSSGAEMVLQTDRSWDMQIWELQGDPQTWQAQLERHHARHPVFAIASGLGGAQWSPIQRFCERHAVPCWFPSVGAVPADAAAGFYSMYFSRGVALEAEVLADHWRARPDPDRVGARLFQVYADAAVGEAAGGALRRQLTGSGVEVVDVHPSPWSPAAVAAQLKSMRPQDAVVLWLPAEALKALSQEALPAGTVYVSGALGRAEHMPLSAAWRGAARVLYPYQLPERRQRGLTVFREWLKVRNLALEDEVLQSEVYFSLSYLNDTMVDMLDNVHRDYLLERGESMLSLREAMRAEDEARELSLPKSNLVDRQVKPMRELPQRRMVPRAPPGAVPVMADAAMPDASAGDAGTSRTSGAPTSTTVYPRLSLGQFQRYASKGAYIVRFAGTEGLALRAETDWIIP